MKTVTVQIISNAPYSQSRQHDAPKLEKETYDAYELRTWREKCNVGPDGDTAVVPAMAFKQALDTVAKRLGDQIPGKGRATYAKHFAGGVVCDSDMLLEGCLKSTAPSVTIHANSNGIRGSGKRVRRTFPQWSSWRGTASFIIMDDTVTREVFERHLTEAGRFIGIGRFRPENGGLNGRFTIGKCVWRDV